MIKMLYYLEILFQANCWTTSSSQLSLSENGSATIFSLSDFRTGEYFVGKPHQIVRREPC